MIATFATFPFPTELLCPFPDSAILRGAFKINLILNNAVPAGIWIILRSLISRLKPYLRWVIVGGTLFFLGLVLKNHWEQVLAIRVSAQGWGYLAVAFGITLVAHICAGWVWTIVLRRFRQPVQTVPLIQAYLKTTVAKYLPGNIWHFYGRVLAARDRGIALEAATVSVLLEPLLMAAAALLLTLLCSRQIVSRFGIWGIGLQWAGLLGVLAIVHPRFLNPLLRRLERVKQKALPKPGSYAPFQLHEYPLIPFLGELGFLVLRGIGFLFTFLAISPLPVSQVLMVLSVFSLAWLLGLVVPGAPGGIGVFEATAIALLGQMFSPSVLLSVVALYRLVSVLAEVAGAGLAVLGERWESKPS